MCYFTFMALFYFHYGLWIEMSLFLKHEGADDEVENGGLLASLQFSGKPHEYFAFAVKNIRDKCLFWKKGLLWKSKHFHGWDTQDSSPTTLKLHSQCLYEICFDICILRSQNARGATEHHPFFFWLPIKCKFVQTSFYKQKSFQSEKVTSFSRSM